jgi:hypothetical protein
VTAERDGSAATLKVPEKYSLVKQGSDGHTQQKVLRVAPQSLLDCSVARLRQWIYVVSVIAGRPEQQSDSTDEQAVQQW